MNLIIALPDKDAPEHLWFFEVIMHVMKSQAKINLIQSIIGITALLFGSVIYIIRSPGNVYFIPKYFSRLQFPDILLNLIKMVGGNLPDFIHPFAFILMTSGLLSLRKKTNQFLVCLCWFLLESFFEFGQYFKEAYMGIIPFWFDCVPILAQTRNFFLYGTFDAMDMLWIFAGTVVAFFVLLITSEGAGNED